MSEETIHRFSSRRERIDKSFLSARLSGAKAYDRIAGYFSSSLLEVVGEELESIGGPIRIVCNSELNPQDVQTAKAAKMGLWKGWTSSQPEVLLDRIGETTVRNRFQKLYDLLSSDKLQVRVLPNSAFGLIHGKAGVITLKDGSKTAFLGSVNESKYAWRLNYELVWEDTSPEGVAWVQDEFDSLWRSHLAFPLSNAVIQDIERIAKRHVLHTVDGWISDEEKPSNPAAVIIESPVYRKEVGLWEHQKFFVNLAFNAHQGSIGKARFVLADQVGLGKTIQLAMTAQLIGLVGKYPILVICPKTLIWQWQDEMRELLDMPSAVWDGRRWVDERGFDYPTFGPEGIRKCPRRVGIISSGLISHGSESSRHLLNLQYDCVILDEAHRARRRNLGENRDQEDADPNNLLRFMYDIALCTRSLMLATATPVQLRPIEAWDLLDILSRGDDSVLGNPYSQWREAEKALPLIMGHGNQPDDEISRWEWVRNPLPPKEEHRDFEVLRNRLNTPDNQLVVPGDQFSDLQPPERQRVQRLFPRFFTDHHPFIRRIIRRTRQQLESQIDPETKEPFIKPIGVELYGEGDQEAIPLPAYLREAYELAEEFCQVLGGRMKGSGFLKTLLLRRVGSSINAGMLTAQRMLEKWDSIPSSEEEDDVSEDIDIPILDTATQTSKTLTDEERQLLERFIAALEANKERDPKYGMVIEYLRGQVWLDLGCIIFSQYRDSIQWLAEQLTLELPEEPIALYSGPVTSGIILDGEWTPHSRETIKEMVRTGEIRLMLGTDAASEGVNLQRLGTLINLDLPWNPTRLEQRKGRIQRIGQLNDTVKIYNMRYKDSVEDRVHQLLSSRLKDIHDLFGQIPDVLEDVWVDMAIGEKEEAKRIIDAIPVEHPFELRYTELAKVDWESCTEVLSAVEKKRILSEGWISR